LHIDEPMRLVGTALLLGLLGTPALADDAKPAEAKPVETRAKVPLRVVRMLPEAHQALLFDRTKGAYVVVEVGQTVEGLTVDSIDSDEVDLLSDGGALVVLAAPAQMRHRRSAGEDDDEAVAPVKPAPAGTAPAATAPAATAPATTAPAATAPATASTAKAEPQPADPYAASGEAQPSDPYADPIQVVDAGSSTASSLGTGKDGVRVVEAPGTPAVAIVTPAPTAVTPAPTAAPTAPTAVTTGPTTIAAAPTSRDAVEGAAIAALMTGAPAPSSPATATVTAAAAPAGPTVLARADVNAALGNFGAMSAAIHGGFTAEGLRIDSVAAGSLFAKAGLRAGDVVTSVDGRPLHSLDDAANLYARAPAMKAATASVLRGGKPVTLRVSIQ
jgi:membrane-associated protease RseP (regulator of RpoE activity)